MVCYSQKSVNELYSKADIEFKKGNYAEVVDYNIRALKLIEKGNNPGATAFGIINVGRSYYFLHQRRVALSWFFKAREIIYKNKIDTLKYKVAYNIGVMYSELAVPDSSLIYYEEAKLALQQNPNYVDLTKLYAVIADLHLNVLHNYETAKKHIVQAEKYAEKINDPKWKAFVCIKYSLYYKFQKDYVMAEKYARRGLELYSKSGEVEGRMYALRVLGLALALGKNPESVAVYEKLLILKDSVFKAEAANKMANYKTLYETEKKVHENKLLMEKNKLNQTEIDAKNKTILGLIIGVLLIIITVFWRISVLNLKKKNRELEAAQAVQKEKERISRDLHDNVGGQLSYVLYSLDGINETNKQKRAELTTNINESVRNVINNLRETIWAINDESITIQDFSDKLKVYARTMFRNTETQVMFDEKIESNLNLNSAAGLNLYRICQEIINNAFKHSKATELKIKISVDQNIEIRISDNGIGFDQKNQSTDGFGLSNIKSRAEEIGVSLNLKTESGQGVSYTLIV